jgi:N-formylglutamate amidohydrolase
VHDLFTGALDQGAVMLDALFPRSYIDPNRAQNDFLPASLVAAEADHLPFQLEPTVKSDLGIGLIWMRVPPDGEPMYPQPLAAATVLQRLAGYYQPYHAALRECLDRTYRTFGRVFHINCHSMSNQASAMSTQPKGTRRPDFVIGDRDGTSCDPLLTQILYEFLTAQGYQVTINDPYKGVELVRAYSDPVHDRHSVQLEINRQLYMDETSREKNSDFGKIQIVLKQAIDALAPLLHTSDAKTAQ